MSKSDDPEIDLQPVIERLNEALESSDIVLICGAIGEAISQHNVSDVAKKAALKRTTLYRAFGNIQNAPNFSTVLNVLDAMDLHFVVVKRNKRRQGAVRKARPNRNALKGS